ncbi:hypothetical protein LEP1GSC058_3736 [Leptospira fainei serovar Hurstbridge str. BUT 6]|uniref:Uncharacterized protein n=1 Tax=Leptospira fainei serovar Hurstbridge str. BUT 6 TaxID=1193011 RepID=S3UV14_9LEPT|nr:hypothetical protein LEP1GSC058_3736 [Leptospira fainei serovar Hurstbridge str. BUT 6]
MHFFRDNSQWRKLTDRYDFRCAHADQKNRIDLGYDQKMKDFLPGIDEFPGFFLIGN